MLASELGGGCVRADVADENGDSTMTVSMRTSGEPAMPDAQSPGRFRRVNRCRLYDEEPAPGQVIYCRVDANGVPAEWVEATVATTGQPTLIYFSGDGHHI